MNTFLVVLLILGGILVFFVPVIMENLTGTRMKHVKGRTYAFVKEKKFIDTEEGMALQSIVAVLDKEGIGPYSDTGLFRIRLLMDKAVPDYHKTIKYTDDNIRTMLKWIGIEENNHTKREKVLDKNVYESAHNWFQEQAQMAKSSDINVEQE